MNLTALAIEIHASNVEAGWWTDIQTGVSTLETRNRPEMLMLAVSELSEAYEGNGQMDDKLTHLPMYDVELADFVIRQLDQIGAEMSLGHEAPQWGGLFSTELTRAWTDSLRWQARSTRLMVLVGHVSAAMEHLRKGRTDDYMNAMALGVLDAFRIAAIDHIDLLDIITQKRAFNAKRADHQVANRVKAGGKQF